MFNIADSCVVVGACLVVALTFKGLNLDGTKVVDEDTAKAEANTENPDADGEGKKAE